MAHYIMKMDLPSDHGGHILRQDLAQQPTSFALGSQEKSFTSFMDRNLIKGSRKVMLRRRSILKRGPSRG